MKSGIYLGIEKDAEKLVVLPYEKYLNKNNTIIGMAGNGMSFYLKLNTMQLALGVIKDSNTQNSEY